MTAQQNLDAAIDELARILGLRRAAETLDTRYQLARLLIDRASTVVAASREEREERETICADLGWVLRGIIKRNCEQAESEKLQALISDPLIEQEDLRSWMEQVDKNLDMEEREERKVTR